MPKVSVIIPTYNRPELVGKAIRSVLGQTYKDFEIIVVDGGLSQRAGAVVSELNNDQVCYIKSDKELNGSAARNLGIKGARGRFIAFLDDDDTWFAEKLEVQMGLFENTSADVGFCFSAVRMVRGGGEFETKVPDGIGDYFERAIANFNGFLTVTLIIKRYVFKEAGLFDEKLPSHQEIDLVIRMAERYKGLGVNRPLVNVSMARNRAHVGGDLEKRVAGRMMILEKHKAEFQTRPKILSRNYFEMAILFRDKGEIKQERVFLEKALGAEFNLRYFIHYLRSFFWL